MMSYNLLCESNRKIDWKRINEQLKSIRMVEFVPIPAQTDSIGLSIPIKNVGEATWEELCLVLRLFINEYHFSVYELYSGNQITMDNIIQIKKQVT